MKKLSVLMLAVLWLSLTFAPGQPAFAYEETLVLVSMQTIGGNITEVNTDQKRVTARWLADEILLKYQDIVLDVPDTCVITKNGRTIELDDLEPNDPATIRFDSNAQPLPRASSITVTE